MAELSAHCNELEADRVQLDSDFASLREDIEQCAALQVSLLAVSCLQAQDLCLSTVNLVDIPVTNEFTQLAAIELEDACRSLWMKS